jgi:two-component system sensor histidine kinase ComP
MDDSSFPDPKQQAEVLTLTGEELSFGLQNAAIAQGTWKLSLWFLGGMFASLGSLVFLRRPDLPAARWFAAMAASAAMALSVAPAAGGPHPEWALVMQAVAFAAIGVTWLPFILHLIEARPTSTARTTKLLLAIGLLVLAGYFASVLVRPTLYTWVRPAFLLYVAASLVGAVLVLARFAGGRTSPVQAWQSRVALFGVAAGVLPFILLSLVPDVTRGEPFVELRISVLAVGLVPTAFAYAILQHQLLGIRKLVHRGMVYAITSMATFLVVIVTLTGVTSLLSEESSSVSLTATALLMTAGVAMFPLVRQGARLVVDRLVYSDVVQYDAFVSALKGDLPSSSHTTDAIAGIAQRLVDVLQLESAVLYLGSDQREMRMVTAVGPNRKRAVPSP